MKKILLMTVSLSLLIVSFSLAYYFVIFLPRNQNMQKKYESQIKVLQRQTSDIEDRVQSIQEAQPTVIPEANSEDIQNAVNDKINQEMQNQANCEGLGGRYQGNGTCVYY